MRYLAETDEPYFRWAPLWTRAAAILVAFCAPAWPLCAQAGRTLGNPLPIELAVSLRGHDYRAPINLSPDGEWIAHTTESTDRVPRDTVRPRRMSAWADRTTLERS